MVTLVPGARITRVKSILYSTWIDRDAIVNDAINRKTHVEPHEFLAGYDDRQDSSTGQREVTLLIGSDPRSWPERPA